MLGGNRALCCLLISCCSQFRLGCARHPVWQEGGAIYNKGVIKFLKNASAVFYDNHTYRDEDNGGQVTLDA